MWRHFVILGGMRTGSNYLQANLDEYAGLRCLGELFNPHFIDRPGTQELFGLTLARRDADPQALIEAAIAAGPGLMGFRLFHDHDPRVLASVLADTRVAKVVLSRNPLESYVSLRIAAATGQWQLRDVSRRRRARVRFDPAGFTRHLDETREFHATILRSLQHSGQSAFFLDYQDVGEVAVMNGLARWLGLEEERRATSGRLRRQNPEPVAERLSNPEEMQATLAGLDPFAVAALPQLEPRRRAGVGRYLGGLRVPLLFLPVPGTPVAPVARWLAALDGAGPEELARAFNRKTLRRWLAQHPGHRSFSVLSHPAVRLHDAFRRCVLGEEGRNPAALRTVLARGFGLRPEPAPQGVEEWRAAFQSFLRFVAASLAGQTPLKVEAAWATQQALLLGMAQMRLPDRLLREEELAASLPALARLVGRPAAPFLPEAEDEAEAEAGPATGGVALPGPAQLLDAETEALVRAAHARDFDAFGFGPFAG